MHQFVASDSYLEAGGSGAPGGNATSINNLSRQEQAFLRRSETCGWVGDLYEAWALYQFAQLTLELVRAAIHSRRRSADPAQVEGAVALLTAYGAVESLAWLGVILFLVVCILQAGWSLWVLFLTAGKMNKSAAFTSGVARFSAAGMVAS